MTAALRNKMTKFWQTAFMTCACLSAMSVNARDFQYEGLKYTVLDEFQKTVSTKAGTGYSNPGNAVMGEIIIPSKVSDGSAEYTVTAIGQYGFFNCVELETIQIPSTVNEIGISAFDSCEGLKSIAIPDAVTVIREDTFIDCSSLSEVKLPSKLERIDIGAFEGCSRLQQIDFPKTLKVIGPQTFNSTGLTSVEIPDGVKEIGQDAFNGCEHLEKIHISGSVTQFGTAIFGDCENIREVYYNTVNPVVTSDIFIYSDIYDSATLYVPVGASAKMRAANPWSYFKNIVETDFAGIRSIPVDPVDSTDCDVYTLDGRKIHLSVERVQTGIYLIKTVSGVRKVLIGVK